jgi:glycosyltransferase involved in cell wall biosynthesis
MHFVFVLFNLELGGAERQALILARYLAKQKRASVEVWGFNKSGPVAEICEQYGLPCRLVSFPFDNARVWSLRRLASMLREARPDILLPYTFVPNVICGLVWQWTGARACVWNQRDEGRMPFVAEWARVAVERTPQFISNSEGGAGFLNKLDVDPSKIRIIKNGVELALPKDDRFVWRDRLKIGEGSFVACMIANLHDKKDHRTLLRAWRRVVNEMNSRAPVLVLAGRHDGAYESLAVLSRELNLDEHVRFAGHVSDVSGLLSAADLGVFSSLYEGCPNGVLESMAAGLAVAGTDVEAISSVLGPAGAPFLAAPGNDESLAAAILKLVNDPDLRVTIGKENKKWVAENYTAVRMCEETTAVLEGLISDVH